MIVFNSLLQNGLGNRLFQIAAASAHALKMNTLAWLCDFEYQNYFTGPFFIKVNTDFEQRIFGGTEHTVYQEEFYKYKKIPESRNLILRGYFQNERYFSDFKSNILKMFSPNEAFLSLLKSDELFRKILLHKNSISIHIRRGDYVKLHHVFNPLDANYYCNALIHIRNRICLHEPSLVVIFSDGHADERKFIFSVCKKLGFEVAIFSENRKDITDMMLMACCRHHVIANSSFSWWGAYLSANFNSLHELTEEHKKIIVGPKKWFTQEFCNQYQAGINSLDCNPMPKDWHRV